MSEIEHLSPNTRHQLWQCFELLLRLAAKANIENTAIDDETREDQKETQTDVGHHIAGIEAEQTQMAKKIREQ